MENGGIYFIGDTTHHRWHSGKIFCRVISLFAVMWTQITRHSPFGLCVCVCFVGHSSTESQVNDDRPEFGQETPGDCLCVGHWPPVVNCSIFVVMTMAWECFTVRYCPLTRLHEIYDKRKYYLFSLPRQFSPLTYEPMSFCCRWETLQIREYATHRDSYNSVDGHSIIAIHKLSEILCWISITSSRMNVPIQIHRVLLFVVFVVVPLTQSSSIYRIFCHKLDSVWSADRTLLVYTSEAIAIYYVIVYNFHCSPGNCTLHSQVTTVVDSL